MLTQTPNLEWVQTSKNQNHGFATLFFLVGAPHIYSALRSRAKRRTGLSWRTGFMASIGLLMAAIAGLVEVLAF